MSSVINRLFGLTISLMVMIPAPCLAGRGGTVNRSSVYVKAHYQNGRYVPGHFRSAPNASRFDNWSTIGNINPYTGKPGTIDPFRPRPGKPLSTTARPNKKYVVVGAARQDDVPNERLLQNAVAAIADPPLPMVNKPWVISTRPPTEEEHVEFLLECLRDLQRGKKWEAVDRRARELLDRYPGTATAREAQIILQSIPY